jgi:hypothetical protein
MVCFPDAGFQVHRIPADGADFHGKCVVLGIAPAFY